jgi:predicted secreted protein
MKKLCFLIFFSVSILFSIIVPLIKCSEIVNVEWSHTFGGAKNEAAYSITKTGDGGYVLAGSTTSFGTGLSDFWVVKTDSSGTMKWNRTYGGMGDDIASAIINVGDGFAILGMTSSFGAGGFDYWLVRVDSDDNMLWNKTYGGVADDFGTRVIQTSDGGYAMTGWTNSFGSGGEDIWLVKTDSSGNMVWNKTYGSNYNDEAHGLVQTSDESYLIAGDTAFASGNEDAWLLKVGSNGNMLWNRTFGGSELDAFLSIEQLSDGSIALSGYTASYGSGSNEAWLVKSDSTGTLQWNKTYGGSNDDQAYALINADDGGFALAGQTTVNTQKNYWLTKTDSSGNIQWNIKNNATMNNFGYSLVQAKDNGYVLSGTANTKDNGEDFLLVKVNAVVATSGLSATEIIGLAALATALLIIFLVLVKRKSWQGRRAQV